MASPAPAPAPDDNTPPPAPAPSVNFNFAESYSRTKHKPLRVNSATVHGNERTSSKVVERELRGLADINNLHDLATCLLDATNRLQALDVFHSVDILVDAGPPNRPNTCDVHVNLRERDMLAFNAGTYVQGNEVSAEGTVSLVNPLGQAEQVQLEASAGSQRSGTFSLAYQLPRFAGTDNSALELRAFQSLQSHQRHASFSEMQRGVSAAVHTPAAGTSVGYELSWREVSGATGKDHACSNAVREQLGNRLKSAVFASAATPDRRAFDSMGVRPVSGTAARVTAELSGVGFWGSAGALVRHARTEAEAALSVPLPVIGPDVALTLGARTGVLLPLGGPGETTYIVDRFYLGGAGGPVRGFINKGCGPSDARRARVDASSEGGADGTPVSVPTGGAGAGRDSLGGDVMAMASASVAFPLPNKVLHEAGVYGHVFADVGATVPLDTSAGMPSSTGEFTRALAGAGRSLASQPRVCVGAGIAWGMRLGRIELNYVHVPASQPFDGVKNGVQVGFSASSIF